MNTKLTQLFVALVVTLALTGSAAAQVIAIDFYNSDPTDQVPDTSAAVGPYATAGWYNTYNVNGGANLTPTGGSGISLVDSSNTATGASFGFTQGGNALNGRPIYNSSYGAMGAANAGLSASGQLYNGAAQASPNDGGFAQEVTLKNIPYATYSAYVLVYSIDQADLGYPYPTGGFGSLTLYTDVTTSPVEGTTYWFYNHSQTPPDGSSFLAATSTDSANPTQGANYVLYTGLTSSDISFDLNSYTHDGNSGSYIAGVEIVEAISSVPEPSTYALLLGGLALIVFLQRRRQSV